MAGLEAAGANLRPSRRQPRVAIVGFQLESNSFAPVVRRDDFSHRDGQSIVDTARGGRAPLDMETGFFTTMDAALPTWEPVPLFNLNGGAAGAVDEAFCQEVVADVEAQLASAGPLDAVYCPMHGGMRASETADSDGEFLAAVRRAVGPGVFVIATLDLHSNISEQMVEATSCMVAMRTNPHVDTAQRGEEAACCLLQMLAGVARPQQMAVRLPLCPPAVCQLTALNQPYGNVLRRGQELLDQGGLAHILNISAVSGFPWADTDKNGFTVIVTAKDGEDLASVSVAKAAAVELAQLAWSQLDDFQPGLTALEDSVAAAQAAADSGKPIVLCDCADNPGAGARGNTIYVLKALLDAQVRGVCFGVFNDAVTVAAAAAAGEGETFTCELNSAEPDQFSEALTCDARVMRISDGRFEGKMGMVAGSKVNLGESCLLELGGPEVSLQLVVISRRQQILSVSKDDELCTNCVSKTRNFAF